MPPRLNKRQLREQEDLLALRSTGAVSDSDGEEMPSSVEKPTGFYTLPVEYLEEEDSTEGPSKPKKGKRKKREITTTAAQNPLQPRVFKKSKKKKRQPDGSEDIDKVLAELLLDSHSPLSAAGDVSNPAPSRHKRFTTLLSISLQHLDGELEMRRFFGSKTVVSTKTPTRTAPKRVSAAHRSALTNPKPNWWPAQLREGLSARQLTPDEHEDKLFRHGWQSRPEEVWWTIDYGKKYRAITMGFMQVVMAGDPEGFNQLLRTQPYHADTLLQLAEVYTHREEYSLASDFIDRAIFTYERGFAGAFSFTSGCNRLDFDRVENRPFFLALHRQLVDLHRRGCTRTAFEFAKLLYSLDPWTDPHGALLHLDGLALKTGMHEWVLDVWEYFETDGDDLEGRLTPNVLPGWWFTRALATKIREDGKELQDHMPSIQLFVAAVLRFPSLLPLLADRGDITLPGGVQSKPASRVHSDLFSLQDPTDAVVQLLCHLYVQRWGDLWLEGRHSTWLSDCVKSLSALGSIHASQNEDRSTVLAATTIRTSIYRHVTVLEKTCRSLFSFIPKDILKSKQLACDPLPPHLRVSEYNEEFFRGVADVLGYQPRRQDSREEGRLLERLVPDGVFRRQLQDFFAAHPNFAQRFPGGIIQFAQLAAQLPEDALEDLMIVEVNGMGAQHPDVGMPGQLQGEIGVLDFEHNAADQPPVVEGVEADSSDDEMDIEPLPVRVLRNVVNRFLGRGTPRFLGGDEDVNLDQDGVD